MLGQSKILKIFNEFYFLLHLGLKILVLHLKVLKLMETLVENLKNKQTKTERLSEKHLSECFIFLNIFLMTARVSFPFLAL